ncbi:amidohydrolase family protein [Planctomycetota bacterium]
MKFFDCNAWAGVARIPPLKPVLTPEALLAEMDRCGIDEALVNHAGGNFENPIVSNPEIAAFCAASPRLHPIWNILPPQTGEMTPDQLIADMKTNDVKGVNAFPNAHKYIISAVSVGSLFEAFIARHIPLFLSVTGFETSFGGVDAGWENVYRILKEFPELTLVATDHGCWGQDRLFRPLIEHYPNFYIDTSRYELDGGIEEFINTYGPSRLLFGTSFHNAPMGSASLLLRNARISEDARALIAAGNLERLLGEIQL